MGLHHPILSAQKAPECSRLDTFSLLFMPFLMLSFSHIILNPIYTVIIIVFFSAQTYYWKSISHYLLDIPAWISEAN